MNGVVVIRFFRFNKRGTSTKASALRRRSQALLGVRVLGRG